MNDKRLKGSLKETIWRCIMLKKLVLISGFVLIIGLVIVGCTSDDGNDNESDWPDYENMTNDEVNEFFGSMSEEERQAYMDNMSDEEYEAYMAGIDWEEFTGEDGPVIYTEEMIEQEFEEMWRQDFESEELGSGVNPASIGEKITRETQVFDLAAISAEEDIFADPEFDPATIELTLLNVTYGHEAWDILSEDPVNLEYLSPPEDFDYVIVEFELTMIEGPEYGMMIPSFLGTTDYEGNMLSEDRPIALLADPLIAPDREDLNFHVGETLSGEMLTTGPKDTDYLIHLLYATNEYVFFEFE